MDIPVPDGGRCKRGHWDFLKDMKVKGSFLDEKATGSGPRNSRLLNNLLSQQNKRWKAGGDKWEFETAYIEGEGLRVWRVK